MDKSAVRVAPTREELSREIPRIVETGFYSFTDHLDGRSDERGIPDHEVLRVVGQGNIAEDPVWDEDYGNWKVKMTGSTVDGDSITVVLAVDLEDEFLDLITAY